MDDRGQAVVLGAVLLFGIVTIAFAGYQAYQVPNQNAGIELQDLEATDDSWTQLHVDYLNTASTGTPRTSTLTLGEQYPPRPLAINPPPVTGVVRTVPASVSKVISSSPGNSGSAPGNSGNTPGNSGSAPGNSGNAPGNSDSGSNDDLCSDETRFLLYTAQYNELPNDPTWVINGGLAYRETPGDPVLLSQQLITDDTIRLVRTSGEFNRTGTRTISVTHNSTGLSSISQVTNPTISIPTRLTETKAEALFEQDNTTATIRDEDIIVSDDRLEISLDGSYTVYCGSGMIE